jgi:hypothetical protein
MKKSFLIKKGIANYYYICIECYNTQYITLRQKLNKISPCVCRGRYCFENNFSLSLIALYQKL